MEQQARDQRRQRIQYQLRTRQLQYLEYISERDDVSVPLALSKIIESARDRIYVDPPIKPKKQRKHFKLSEACLAYVRLLASRWGLNESDVVRRLIDDAAARDPTV